MPAMGTARVIAIDRLVGDVSALTLQSLQKGYFGSPSPGAHLDIETPANGTRQYSIYDWAGNTVLVAVKSEPAGRGGSRWICGSLSVGDTLKVGRPRNHFQLNEEGSRYLLIAGGIGVTPIHAMAVRLHRLGKAFVLKYFIRSHATAAFGPLLAKAPFAARVQTHLSDVEGLPDFETMLEDVPPETEIYVCGPEPMLQAITTAGARRGLQQIRFERFGPIVAADTSSAGFSVLLKRSGKELFVPPDKTLLDVLSAAGISVEAGCREGVCGSCLTQVMEGRVDHRDSILDESARDRNEIMCVCVSRALSDRLVLDL